MKNENAVVSSLISKEQAQASPAGRMVEETFQGSMPAFIAAFSRSKEAHPGRGGTAEGTHLTITRRIEHEHIVPEYPDGQLHGIIILAVMLLRLVLKKRPSTCLLWLLAGLRLLMPSDSKRPELAAQRRPGAGCSSSAIPRRPPRRKISPRPIRKSPRRYKRPRRFRISSPPLPP